MLLSFSSPAFLLLGQNAIALSYHVHEDGPFSSWVFFSVAPVPLGATGGVGEKMIQVQFV